MAGIKEMNTGEQVEAPLDSVMPQVLSLLSK
jgi:hypothetical protein